MTDKLPLDFLYDKDADVLTVNGQAYSGQLFRAFAKGGMPSGSLFEFFRHPNGMFSVRVIYDPTKKVKPA